MHLLTQSQKQYFLEGSHLIQQFKSLISIDPQKKDCQFVTYQYCVYRRLFDLFLACLILQAYVPKLCLQDCLSEYFQLSCCTNNCKARTQLLFQLALQYEQELNIISRIELQRSKFQSLAQLIFPLQINQLDPRHQTLLYYMQLSQKDLLEFHLYQQILETHSQYLLNIIFIHFQVIYLTPLFFHNRMMYSLYREVMLNLEQDIKIRKYYDISQSQIGSLPCYIVIRIFTSTKLLFFSQRTIFFKASIALLKKSRLQRAGQQTLEKQSIFFFYFRYRLEAHQQEKNPSLFTLIISFVFKKKYINQKQLIFLKVKMSEVEKCDSDEMQRSIPSVNFVDFPPLNQSKGFRTCFIVSLISITLIGVCGLVYYFNELKKESQFLENQISGLKQRVSENEESLKSIQKYLQNIAAKSDNPDIQRKFFPLRDLRIQPKENFTAYYCALKQVKNEIPKNGEREVLVDTMYNFPIYIDTGGIKTGMFNSVAYFIAMYGTWQPQNIFAMGKLIRPGFKILNVGAQFGLQCLALARIAGPTGKAVMFEPYSYSYNNLVKSIQINNLTSTAQVHKLAVSDKPGKGFISVALDNTGMSQINNPSFGGQQKQEIQIVVLDDYLPKNTTFDFVLIDAQRYEIQVILSMKQIIKRSPYLVIVTEWSWKEKTPQSRDKVKADQMINFLKSLDYRIFIIEKFNNQKFDAYKCILGRKDEVDWNYLFVTQFTDLILVPPKVILPY